MNTDSQTSFGEREVETGGTENLATTVYFCESAIFVIINQCDSIVFSLLLLWRKYLRGKFLR